MARLLLALLLSCSVACASATAKPPFIPPTQPLDQAIEEAVPRRPTVLFHWYAPDSLFVCFEQRLGVDHPICFTLKELRSWAVRQQKL